MNRRMQTDLKKFHLLLAAGEMVLQRVLVHVLKDAGYIVATAQTGVEALFILNTFHCTPKKIDLLLLDFSLPKLSSTDLLQRLEKSATTEPIIIFTSKVNGDIKQNLPQNLNLHLMETPVIKEELLALIQHVLLTRDTDPDKTAKKKDSI